MKHSQYKGVTKQGNKWKARFSLNYEDQHLGYFDDPKEAHWAWLRALRETDLIDGDTYDVLRGGDIAIRIGFNGQTLKIGKYETEQEAHEAVLFIFQKPPKPSTIKPKTGLPAGVSSIGDRYRAKIFAHGKDKYLGTFDTPEQAHRAYVRAARKLGRTIDETTQEQDS